MLTSIFLNGLKLPSFFWYTFFDLGQSHDVSGEIKLAFLQKVPLQLVQCNWFLALDFLWFKLLLWLNVTYKSATRTFNVASSQLPPQNPGHKQSNRRLLWDFLWNVCAGAKGDFFARSEGIGCIWKALVTFLVISCKMNLSKNQRRVKR